MPLVDAEVRVPQRQPYAVAIPLPRLHGHVDEPEQPELLAVEAAGAPLGPVPATAELAARHHAPRGEREGGGVDEFFARFAARLDVRDAQDPGHWQLAELLDPHAEVAGGVGLRAVVEFERSGPGRRHHEHGLLARPGGLDRKRDRAIGRLHRERNDLAAALRLAHQLHVRD